MNQFQTYFSKLHRYPGAKVKFAQLLHAFMASLPAGERRWWSRGLVMKETQKLATVGRGSDKCCWVIGYSLDPQPPVPTYKVDAAGKLVRTAVDDAGAGI